MTPAEEVESLKARVAELEERERRCFAPFDPEAGPDLCEHVIQYTGDLKVRVAEAEATVAGMREVLEGWPLGKALLPVSVGDAGKPYLEVVEAAAKWEEAMQESVANRKAEIRLALAVRALAKSRAKLDNPADSLVPGSLQSDANPKEKSDHS